ncbi:hypothetical protein P3T27_007903 [Kitasatospora sp. MAA19]|nr:hypothetical protein [Kitasatospora sp. MAA19]MDH6711151.1 hypothetical protein [Kitasatospora sp. MAA19]
MRSLSAAARRPTAMASESCPAWREETARLIRAMTVSMVGPEALLGG